VQPGHVGIQGARQGGEPASGPYTGIIDMDFALYTFLNATFIKFLYYARIRQLKSVANHRHREASANLLFGSVRPHVRHGDEQEVHASGSTFDSKRFSDSHTGAGNECVLLIAHKLLTFNG